MADKRDFAVGGDPFDQLLMEQAKRAGSPAALPLAERVGVPLAQGSWSDALHGLAQFAGNALPGRGGISAPALRAGLENIPAAASMFPWGRVIRGALLENPIAEQVNRLMALIGGKAPLTPEYLASGGEALAMKLTPPGGPPLALKLGPGGFANETMDAVHSAPRNVLLPPGDVGSIRRPTGETLFDYYTQPLAELPAKVPQADFDLLRQLAARSGWELSDLWPGNVGYHQGRPVVIDAGSFSRMPGNR